jgi:hypothetical protein
MNPTLLINYIDKLANAQTSIQEINHEIGRLRQDARADKFNMEAVHLLGIIIAKSPHDNGVGLLTDMLRYAKKSGIQPEKLVPEHNGLSKEQDHIDQNDSFDVSRFTSARTILGERSSLIVQFVLGIFIAGSLIWLLR